MVRSSPALSGARDEENGCLDARAAPAMAVNSAHRFLQRCRAAQKAHGAAAVAASQTRPETILINGDYQERRLQANFFTQLFKALANADSSAHVPRSLA